MLSDVIAGASGGRQQKDQYGIRVANFSLNAGTGSSFRWDPLDKVVEKLWFSGVVVVVASGNYGTADAASQVRYAPANDPFVITVGASDTNATQTSADDFAAPWSAWVTPATVSRSPTSLLWAVRCSWTITLPDNFLALVGFILRARRLPERTHVTLGADLDGGAKSSPVPFATQCSRSIRFPTPTRSGGALHRPPPPCRTATPRAARSDAESCRPATPRPATASTIRTPASTSS